MRPPPDPAAGSGPYTMPVCSKPGWGDRAVPGVCPPPPDHCPKLGATGLPHVWAPPWGWGAAQAPPKAFTPSGAGSPPTHGAKAAEASPARPQPPFSWGFGRAGRVLPGCRGGFAGGVCKDGHRVGTPLETPLQAQLLPVQGGERGELGVQGHPGPGREGASPHLCRNSKEIIKGIDRKQRQRPWFEKKRVKAAWRRRGEGRGLAERGGKREGGGGWGEGARREHPVPSW